MDINKIMSSLEAKHPGESEYLQAVREVLLSIEDIYNQHPEFEKAKIIERLVEPDRIFTFRVTFQILMQFCLSHSPISRNQPYIQLKLKPDFRPA